jgi:hypothetical protein
MRSEPDTDGSAAKSSAADVTPESITAMPTLDPSRPRAWRTVVAPMVGPTRSSEPSIARSSDICPTSELAARVGIATFGTSATCALMIPSVRPTVPPTLRTRFISDPADTPLAARMMTRECPVSSNERCWSTGSSFGNQAGGPIVPIVPPPSWEEAGCATTKTKNRTARHWLRSDRRFTGPALEQRPCPIDEAGSLQ